MTSFDFLIRCLTSFHYYHWHDEDQVTKHLRRGVKRFYVMEYAPTNLRTNCTWEVRGLGEIASDLGGSEKIWGAG